MASPGPSPKKKVTLYFSSGMLEETQREGIRQDRSISWIIQAAWRIARDEVRRLPGVAAGAVAQGEQARVGSDGPTSSNLQIASLKSPPGVS
jgi:uncharacterized small protein (TIGR04563 family)